MWRPEIQISCKGPESEFPVKIIDLVLDRNPEEKHLLLRNTLTSCVVRKLVRRHVTYFCG